MLKRKIGLFTGISGSFALIIAMSFLLGISIEHFNIGRRLPILLTEVQTGNIANSLSILYTRQGNWDNLTTAVRDIITTMPDSDYGNALRVVVEDENGNTLYNSFSELIGSSGSILVEGESSGLIDYVSGRNIGKVILFLDDLYLEQKTTEYLITILKDELFLTICAMIIALIPAAWLSRRLTSPLIKLSKASQEIRTGNLIQVSEEHRTRELSELSSSFNSMAAALKRQRELRQRLIGDLSHEINTPLNIISLDARGIKDGLISVPEGVDSILSEIDKLSSLIKDLDWLAETDAGKIRLNKQICPLNLIIEDEINCWRFKMEKAGMTFIFDDSTNGQTTVNIDPLRIRQVLTNLLNNCLRYASESDEIRIKTFIQDKHVHISVADQGPGIPADEVSKIFERFYRLEVSRNRGTGGRGLGLSIVKSIVEMHKGRVCVESNPDGGSSFIVSLPLSL